MKDNKDNCKNTVSDAEQLMPGVGMLIKKGSADDDITGILQLQMGLAKRSKVADFITVVVSALILYGLVAAFLILPDKAYSEDENRELMQLPTITLSDLSREAFDKSAKDDRNGTIQYFEYISGRIGKFTADFGTYMADQFPMRDFFVGVKAAGETAMLNFQNDGAIDGADGYLIKRCDYPNEENLRTNLSGIAELSAKAENAGKTTVTALAGRTQDVLDKKAGLYSSYASDRIWSHTDMIANEVGLNFINLRDPLRNQASAGEYVYYKTDHHWTTDGAYTAYTHIIEALGDKPYSADAFDVETVSDSFFGTTYSSAGIRWAKPDTMKYYRYDGDDNFTVTLPLTGDSFTGFYDRSFLETKDKYASFIRGNNGRTDVKYTGDDGETREVLLVFKDSFAHSVVPFLARHYDLKIIDVRYFPNSMLRSVMREDYDKVLFLYNMETLTETDELGFLAHLG